MDYTLDDMKISLDLKDREAFADLMPSCNEDIMYSFMDLLYDFQSINGNIDIDLKDDREKVWLTCTFGEVYMLDIYEEVLKNTMEYIDVFEVEETIDKRIKITVGLNKLPEFYWDYEEILW